MCSLAASGLGIEGGQTNDGSCDQALPVRAVCLLPHGQVRVLAASLEIALGRLSWLPAVDSQVSQDPTRRKGWYAQPASRGSGRAVLTSDVESDAGRRPLSAGLRSYSYCEQPGLLARLTTRLLPAIGRSGPRRHID